MTEQTPPEVPHKPRSDSEKGVVLISYPKVVFLWPAWVVSIIAAIWMSIRPDLSPEGAANTMGWAFLIVLSLNLVVLSFDFPRGTSLLLFAVVVCLILGASLLVVYYPSLLPSVRDILLSIHPVANATFYWIFAIVMALIYVAVAIATRFDYWEVRPNELLHHHGIMSDLKRYSAPHLRIDKEINDVFEYMLAGSGRLILNPSSERRSIVLDNVFFISSKEKRITKLLGALQVQVREE